MNNKKSELSIIIPFNKKGGGGFRDNLVLALAELDYYLEKCKYDFSEIILVGEKESNISGLSEGFKSIIPEILSFSEEEVAGKIKGDVVLVFKPNRKISFDDFKKMVDVSVKKINEIDIFAAYKSKKSFWVNFLDWKTSMLGKIFRLNKKVTVIRDPEIICFSPEAIENISFFNLLRAVVFGEISGRKVEFIETPESIFSPSFPDYLKTWQTMFVFVFKRLKNKMLKKNGQR